MENGRLPLCGATEVTSSSEAATEALVHDVIVEVITRQSALAKLVTKEIENTRVREIAEQIQRISDSTSQHDYSMFETVVTRQIFSGGQVDATRLLTLLTVSTMLLPTFGEYQMMSFLTRYVTSRLDCWIERHGGLAALKVKLSCL